jgi:hypothetical protein
LPQHDVRDPATESHTEDRDHGDHNECALHRSNSSANAAASGH